MEKYKKRQGYLRAVVIIVILTGVVLAGLWWRQQQPEQEQNESPAQQEQSLKTTVDRGFDEEGWQQMQERIEADQKALEEAVNEGENAITERLQLGNSYYAAGELQKAVDEYDKILETHPNDPPALENKGQALYEMGDYYGAETAWRKAVSVDPQVHTYIKLDELYTEHLTERYDEFGPMLEEAVANLGQSRGLMIALGNWHKAQGNIDRAISHYEIAIELSDNADDLEEELKELREMQE
jgi:tetratricopeptide (TPR) repeat protein